MNPILMCCYNNLSLTKQAVDSALMQDVEGGVDLVVVNNGSTDGTGQWFSDLGAIVPRVTVLHMTHNESPCKVANALLQTLFVNSPYVLAIPNDVILPPSTYREFLRWPRGLVTGSEIRDRTAYDAHVQALPATAAVSENTPMAVMLVRRWLWDAVVAKDGYFFDENFTHFVSDCDLALRVAACGIRGVQLNAPYWHYGSASVRLADPFTMGRLRAEADNDRSKFVAKWGFKCDSLEYGQRPSDPNFRGESR